MLDTTLDATTRRAAASMHGPDAGTPSSVPVMDAAPRSAHALTDAGDATTSPDADADGSALERDRRDASPGAPSPDSVRPDAASVPTVPTPREEGPGDAGSVLMDAAASQLDATTSPMDAASQLDATTSPMDAATPQDPTFSLLDISESALPGPVRNRACMDAHAADVDGDGDVDVVLAIEFGANRLLLNDGGGGFAESSLPVALRDSEDVAVRDVDGDGRLDFVFVSEDDRVNELYLRNEDGSYIIAADRFATSNTSNALVAEDLDGDGDVDLIVGNAGPNDWLTNDGFGYFLASGSTLPPSADVTQDLELGDVDADGDLDLIVGNEGRSRLWIREGSNFIDETEQRLPAIEAETREADFGDVDGDGDLDLLFSNVALFYDFSAENVLLLNDGAGRYAALTTLPGDVADSFDGDFADFDLDGDLDVLFANSAFGSGVAGLQVLRQRGGVFVDESSELLASPIVDDGFDLEIADFDGDGLLDVYYCARGGVGQRSSLSLDYVLLQRR